MIKQVLAAAAMLASVSAFAQQTEFTAPDAGFKSTLTRAEVRQQLVEAQAQGLTAMREHDGQDEVVAASGNKSRDAVRAEAAAQYEQAHSRQAVEGIYFR